MRASTTERQSATSAGTARGRGRFDRAILLAAGPHAYQAAAQLHDGVLAISRPIPPERGKQVRRL